MWPSTVCGGTVALSISSHVSDKTPGADGMLVDKACMHVNLSLWVAVARVVCQHAKASLGS
jgi:hypothetical protein